MQCLIYSLILLLVLFNFIFNQSVRLFHPLLCGLFFFFTSKCPSLFVTVQFVPIDSILRLSKRFPFLSRASDQPFLIPGLDVGNSERRREGEKRGERGPYLNDKMVEIGKQPGFADKSNVNRNEIKNIYINLFLFLFWSREARRGNESPQRRLGYIWGEGSRKQTFKWGSWGSLLKGPQVWTLIKSYPLMNCPVMNCFPLP